MPKITMSLNPDSIERAIRDLEKYRDGLEAKGREIAERLAALGATRATLDFSRAIYTGPKDVSVTVEETEKGFNVIAFGTTVLVLEFGAGVTYGYGHPQADEFHMGPGTYPNGKGHWNDPKGWWLPKAKGGGHTFGNPPEMPMYHAKEDMRRQIEAIAREVFSRE